MLKNIFNICIGLLILCFIISIHELGHYLIGRILNIKIREFSVGILGVRFLPKFVDSRKTIWRIGLLPIGGYVAFVEKPVDEPEEPVELQPNFFEKAMEYLKTMSLTQNILKVFKPIKKGITSLIDKTEYSVSQIKGRYLDEIKPLHTIILAVAGPIANFILSFLVLFILYFVQGRIDNKLYFADPEDRYNTTDRIIKINGFEVMSAQQASSAKREEGKVNFIDLMRGDETIKVGMVGLPQINEVENGVQKLNFINAIYSSGKDVIQIILLNLKSLYYLFKGMINLNFKQTKKMSGVIGIVKSGFKEMDKGIYATLRWMALLSISLGVLNLLIIPPFDGSIILLGLVEIIIGKQQRLQDMFSQFAMIVLVFFMFITIKNDVFQRKTNIQEEVK